MRYDYHYYTNTHPSAVHLLLSSLNTSQLAIIGTEVPWSFSSLQRQSHRYAFQKFSYNPLRPMLSRCAIQNRNLWVQATALYWQFSVTILTNTVSGLNGTTYCCPPTRWHGKLTGGQVRAPHFYGPTYLEHTRHLLTKMKIKKCWSLLWSHLEYSRVSLFPRLNTPKFNTWGWRP